MADLHLDKNKFFADFVFTERRGHAYDLAAGAVANGFDIVVAVGGDGTINEVAAAVDGSHAMMGIIPFGSGNGLARSLKIPLATAAALRRLNDLHISRIDTGLLNDRKFFNIAGIGFDAHISELFSKDIKRGLTGYVKATLNEISNYKAGMYSIEVDGQVHQREAFMISIANSSQFGNNAHISPFASLKDGLLDLCIVRPFPLYQFPAMGYRMFNRSAHRSRYIEIIRAGHFRISREKEGAVHLDGEPFRLGTELNIGIKHLSLAILN